MHLHRLLALGLFFGSQSFIASQAAISLTFVETGVNEVTMTANGTYDVGFNDSSSSTTGIARWNTSSIGGTELTAAYRGSSSTTNNLLSLEFVGGVTGTFLVLPLSTNLTGSVVGTSSDDTGFLFTNTGKTFILFGPSGFGSGTTFPTLVVTYPISFAAAGYTVGDTGSFTSGGQTVNWSFAAVPEPEACTLGLAGLTLGVAALCRWRTKMQ